jgi:hypothetical protein
VTRFARRFSTRIALLMVATLSARSLGAQRAQPVPSVSRWRPAFRIDALIDRDPGAQAAISLSVPADYNVRLSLDAGVGGVRRSAGWATSGRLDLLGRWLSDPFRQSRWGLNAGGGIGEQFERGRPPRTVAIITLGVEGPSDGAWVPGVELGLGGGVRAGFTLRRAPARQR